MDMTGLAGFKTSSRVTPIQKTKVRGDAAHPGLWISSRGENEFTS
jgi:hypothetical protein